MIPKEIIKKIKRIHIKSRRTANTLMAGQYKSVFRGSGIEFEEVRSYCPGDDVKAIDWKVSARLGKPFIKLYKEERESIVMLLIDMSSSQMFGTFSGLKLEKAAEIASVLAFNAIKNNDKVGVIFFTDKVEKYIPPKKGSSHIWHLIKEIFTFTPKEKGTNIACALDFLANVSRKKTVSFIISDFIADQYIKNLKIVKQRHEIIGIVLYDKGDFYLPEKGIISIACFETGKTIVLDAFYKKTRKYYENQTKKQYNQSLNNLKKSSVDFIEIGTHMSVSNTLSKYFRYRERKIK
ncbi:MAG: DUF58 domain-containing protein [Desulfobacteraceae bacterium 4572_130]|nr:MAG: DUF58 domain-containing protein [Desulfobacteraceae bacterium 4572_130]